MAELATIARPYAEALYRSGQGADASVQAEQLDALAQVAADTQLRQFADNPKVTADQVFTVVSGVLKSPLLPAVSNLLRAVIDNGRVAALPEIATQYRALMNSGSGVAEATIYSAYPIEPAQLSGVVAALERRFARKLEAQVQIEPELIGGLRVVVGDEVFDTSVKARLEQMKVALTA